MKTTLAEHISKYEEEKLKKKACDLSIKEGSAASVMDGLGTRYVTPFAVALNASNTQIGILSSLPSLIGSFSGLYGARLMKRFTRKKIVSLCVLLQAAMWLALIGIGYLFFKLHIDSNTSPLLLIIAYTLLIIFGYIASPAWNSWMKDIIPEHFGRYFGIRNRICLAVSLISMLIGGFILDYFRRPDIFIGFVIIFSFSFIGRSVSAYLFTKSYEPHYDPEKHEHDGLVHFIKQMTNNNFGKFTSYYALLNFVVALASPFFAVYMLQGYLNLNYVEFTLISMSSIVTKILFMPAWGRFTDKYGNMKAMKIAGFLTPLVPLLWLCSVLVANADSRLLVTYLIFVEALSGAAWAGSDLASSNFLYDALPRERVAMVSVDFSIVNNIGAFLGALVGGILSSQTFVIFGLSSILFVFLLSGILRFVVAALLLPEIEEIRPVEKFGMDQAKKIFLHLNLSRIWHIIR